MHSEAAPEPPKQQQHEQRADANQQQQQPTTKQKRPMCAGCGRPLRVCYCAALPPQPVQLNGRVLLLQHPLETKRVLATVPLLSKVLCPASLSVCVHRRLVCSKWPAAERLLSGAVQQQGVPLLVLFPGPGARSLADVAQELHTSQQQQRSQQQQQQQPAGQQHQQPEPEHQQQQEQEHQQPSYVLLVVDGTWQHAREMFDHLQPQLFGGTAGSYGAVQVQLPVVVTPPQGGQQQQEGGQQAQTHKQRQHSQLQLPDTPQQQQQASSASTAEQQQHDVECKLRTEPAPGCCSTAEAVAAAVALLEGDPQLFDVLMAPLRLLTQHQAAFDPAVAARAQPGGSGVVAHKKKLGMRGRVA